MAGGVDPFAFRCLVGSGTGPLPACPQVDKGTKACKPMREPGSLGDTVSVKIVFPVAFKGVGRNEVVDSLGILAPVLEHLRLVQNGSSEDTVRIVHIGDSHIRGHIFLVLPVPV